MQTLFVVIIATLITICGLIYLRFKPKYLYDLGRSGHQFVLVSSSRILKGGKTYAYPIQGRYFNLVVELYRGRKRLLVVWDHKPISWEPGEVFRVICKPEGDLTELCGETTALVEMS